MFASIRVHVLFLKKVISGELMCQGQKEKKDPK